MPLLRGIPFTSTDASKLERIQRKFVSLCHRRFFSHLPYSYVALNHLKLRTLSDRRCHLDALFLFNVYNGSIFCPILLETVGLRVPNRNFRDFKVFHVNTFTANADHGRFKYLRFNFPESTLVDLKFTLPFCLK